MFLLLLSCLFLTSSNSCEISYKNFICFLKDIRLSGFYHHVVVADKLSCVSACYIDDGCLGLAYHNSTQMCYLYDQFPSGDSLTLDIGIATFLLEDFIPQNIAFKKPTTMSSTFSSNYPSHNAVDGDFRNCMHTKAASLEWWCVDLWKINNFNSVVIYNRPTRTSYAIDRLRGFELRFSDDGECGIETLNGTRLCHKDTRPKALHFYNISSCDQPETSFSSRFIFIKPRPNTYLHIAEIVVTSSDPFC